MNKTMVEETTVVNEVVVNDDTMVLEYTNYEGRMIGGSKWVYVGKKNPLTGKKYQGKKHKMLKKFYNTMSYDDNEVIETTEDGIEIVIGYVD